MPTALQPKSAWPPACPQQPSPLVPPQPACGLTLLATLSSSAQPSGHVCSKQEDSAPALLVRQGIPCQAKQADSAATLAGVRASSSLSPDLPGARVSYRHWRAQLHAQEQGKGAAWAPDLLDGFDAGSMAGKPPESPSLLAGEWPVDLPTSDAQPLALCTASGSSGQTSAAPGMAVDLPSFPAVAGSYPRQNCLLDDDVHLPLCPAAFLLEQSLEAVDTRSVGSRGGATHHCRHEGTPYPGPAQPSVPSTVSCKATADLQPARPDGGAVSAASDQAQADSWQMAETAAGGVQHVAEGSAPGNAPPVPARMCASVSAGEPLGSRPGRCSSEGSAGCTASRAASRAAAWQRKPVLAPSGRLPAPPVRPQGAWAAWRDSVAELQQEQRPGSVAVQLLVEADAPSPQHSSGSVQQPTLCQRLPPHAQGQQCVEEAGGEAMQPEGDSGLQLVRLQLSQQAGDQSERVAVVLLVPRPLQPVAHKVRLLISVKQLGLASSRPEHNAVIHVGGSGDPAVPGVECAATPAGTAQQGMPGHGSSDADLLAASAAGQPVRDTAAAAAEEARLPSSPAQPLPTPAAVDECFGPLYPAPTPCSTASKALAESGVVGDVSGDQWVDPGDVLETVFGRRLVAALRTMSTTPAPWSECTPRPAAPRLSPAIAQWAAELAARRQADTSTPPADPLDSISFEQAAQVAALALTAEVPDAREAQAAAALLAALQQGLFADLVEQLLQRDTLQGWEQGGQQGQGLMPLGPSTGPGTVQEAGAGQTGSGSEEGVGSWALSPVGRRRGGQRPLGMVAQHEQEVLARHWAWVAELEAQAAAAAAAQQAAAIAAQQAAEAQVAAEAVRQLCQAVFTSLLTRCAEEEKAAVQAASRAQRQLQELDAEGWSAACMPAGAAGEATITVASVMAETAGPCFEAGLPASEPAPSHLLEEYSLLQPPSHLPSLPPTQPMQEVQPGGSNAVNAPGHTFPGFAIGELASANQQGAGTVDGPSQRWLAELEVLAQGVDQHRGSTQAAGPGGAAAEPGTAAAVLCPGFEGLGAPVSLEANSRAPGREAGGGLGVARASVPRAGQPVGAGVLLAAWASGQAAASPPATEPVGAPWTDRLPDLRRVGSDRGSEVGEQTTRQQPLATTAGGEEGGALLWYDMALALPPLPGPCTKHKHSSPCSPTRCLAPDVLLERGSLGGEGASGATAVASAKQLGEMAGVVGIAEEEWGDMVSAATDSVESTGQAAETEEVEPGPGLPSPCSLLDSMAPAQALAGEQLAAALTRLRAAGVAAPLHLTGPPGVEQPSPAAKHLVGTQHAGQQGVLAAGGQCSSVEQVEAHQRQAGIADTAGAAQEPALQLGQVHAVFEELVRPLGLRSPPPSPLHDGEAVTSKAAVAASKPGRGPGTPLAALAAQAGARCPPYPVLFGKAWCAQPPPPLELEEESLTLPPQAAHTSPHPLQPAAQHQAPPRPSAAPGTGLAGAADLLAELQPWVHQLCSPASSSLAPAATDTHPLPTVRSLPQPSLSPRAWLEQHKQHTASTAASPLPSSRPWSTHWPATGATAQTPSPATRYPPATPASAWSDGHPSHRPRHALPAQPAAAPPLWAPAPHCSPLERSGASRGPAASFTPTSSRQLPQVQAVHRPLAPGMPPYSLPCSPGPNALQEQVTSTVRLTAPEGDHASLAALNPLQPGRALGQQSESGSGGGGEAMRPGCRQWLAIHVWSQPLSQPCPPNLQACSTSSVTSSLAALPPRPPSSNVASCCTPLPTDLLHSAYPPPAAAGRQARTDMRPWPAPPLALAAGPPSQPQSPGCALPEELFTQPGAVAYQAPHPTPLMVPGQAGAAPPWRPAVLQPHCPLCSPHPHAAPPLAATPSVPESWASASSKCLLSRQGSGCSSQAAPPSWSQRLLPPPPPALPGGWAVDIGPGCPQWLLPDTSGFSQAPYLSAHSTLPASRCSLSYADTAATARVGGGCKARFSQSAAAALGLD
ncbi:hypothetical protein V8C86DRAFT_2833388 [Haematococcus lacustris]